VEERGTVGGVRPSMATAGHWGAKMRWMLLVAGLLAAMAGVVWTLQGLGVLGGSVMSGDRTWAIIGPIVIVIGLALVAYSLRRPGVRR
jgi:hypothetical protein